MDGGKGRGYNYYSQTKYISQKGKAMKVKILAVVLLILVLAAGAFVLLNHMENYNEFFYTKGDNSRVKELNVRADEEMKFEYSLDCCDESGKKRELKFKTDRELREGAYLSLEVRSLGVHSWEEVEYEALPEKVKEKLK